METCLTDCIVINHVDISNSKNKNNSQDILLIFFRGVFRIIWTQSLFSVISRIFIISLSTREIFFVFFKAIRLLLFLKAVRLRKTGYFRSHTSVVYLLFSHLQSLPCQVLEDEKKLTLDGVQKNRNINYHHNTTMPFSKRSLLGLDGHEAYMSLRCSCDMEGGGV